MSNKPITFIESRIGFWRRSGAYLLDFLISLMVGGIIGLIVGSIYVGNEMNEQYDNGRSELNFGGIFGGIYGGILGAILGFFCFSVLIGVIEGLMGWSPGKQMLKLEIRNKSGDKKNVLLCLLRFLIKYSPCFFWTFYFMTVLVGFPFDNYALLAMACSIIVFLGTFLTIGKNKQSLHDLISQTAVYRK